MRAIAALTLGLLMAGCTSSGLDLSDLAPSSATTVRYSATYPRFGDRDPHDWQRREPWTYAIHGTDVAKYQGEVDWAKAKAAGISFAYLKATEGGDRVDDQFESNWRQTRAAGIPRGAYHFFYFCRPAIEQAAWFIRNVPREKGTLPHVLDMEWNHLSPSCKLRPDPETVRSEMRVFLNALTRHYGRKPIIYTSLDFYDDNDLEKLRGYSWWLRSVAGHPDEKYDNQSFVFWQYTGTGIVPGIGGDADINVFNGNAETWREWLRHNTT